MTTPTSSERADGTMARHRNLGDVSSGAVTVVVGLALLVSARTIHRLPGDTEAIGPAAFPTALALILVVAGLALAVNGLRGKSDEGIAAEIMQIDDSRDVNNLIDPDEPPVPVRRLLIMIALFATYCVALIPVGFLLGTAGYLAATTCVVHAQKWRRNVAFAVGFSAVVYFSFTRLLAVELPVGILG